MIVNYFQPLTSSSQILRLLYNVIPRRQSFDAGCEYQPLQPAAQDRELVERPRNLESAIIKHLKISRSARNDILSQKEGYDTVSETGIMLVFRRGKFFLTFSSFLSNLTIVSKSSHISCFPFSE